MSNNLPDIESLRWLAERDEPTSLGATAGGRELVAIAGKVVAMPLDEPARLDLNSLTSLAEWVRDNAAVTYAAVVESPTVVSVLGPWSPVFGHRKLVQAKVEAYTPVSTKMSLPAARNFLLSCGNAEAHALATLLAKVTSVLSTEQEDALMQSLTIKSGVATIENAQLGIEHVLAPPTTFGEIEPVGIRYAVRVRDNAEIQISFAPLDDVVWREVARSRIRAWLREAFAGMGDGAAAVRVL